MQYQNYSINYLCHVLLLFFYLYFKLNQTSIGICHLICQKQVERIRNIREMLRLLWEFGTRYCNIVQKREGMFHQLGNNGSRI